MATFAQIKITFNSDLQVGQNLTILYGFGQSFFETWQVMRSGPNQVSVGTPTANVGERTAINYIQSLELDYMGYGFQITRSVNEVTIKSTNPLFQFGFLSGEPTVDINHKIDNATEELLYVDSLTFSQSSLPDKCRNIKVNIKTSILVSKITTPILVDPNLDNPFSFNYARGGEVVVTMESPKGQVYPYQITLPSVLDYSKVSFNVTNTPSGSTVIVNVIQNGLLNLEYSLDNINFSSSNTFTGLAIGDYVVYVRDQFGCLVSKKFETAEVGVMRSPYFYLPTANSIRFANRVTWGDCSNYKNDFNTLSCEVDVPLPKMEIQQFQTCDKIITQFKSNYKNNVAYVKSLTANVALFLPIVQKTNNLNQKDRRDAELISLNDGSTRTGIYFDFGDTYDYDSLVVNGNYILNGALPVWGKAGNLIQISGVWYLIEDVIYIESVGAEVLVIDTGVTPTAPTTEIVASIYNLQNYEVYEFEIDFFNFMNKNVQISIKAIDPLFDEINFLSEIINVKVRHKRTLEIKYWSDDNTDVFYASGIINKMRMPLEKSYGQPSGSIDSYDTDTDTILLKADIRQLDVFVFEPMTKAFMWKIDEALSHKYVTLDGVRYGEKSIEVSEVLGETNLYDVKVTMKKANVAFRSKGMQFDDSAVEIPALIPTGTGYVKYQ